MDTKQARLNRCFAYTASRGRRENSDAKDGEGRTSGMGRSGWAAVQTPLGGEREEKLSRRIQDYRCDLDYRPRRNNFLRGIETFRAHTTCRARLRNHHETYGLNCGTIHGGMIVGHSRHRVHSRHRA